MMKFCLLCSFWIFFAGTSLNGQAVPDMIPAHDSFRIESKQVFELRTINVWVPPGYVSGKDSFPVLYMPDGGINEDFPHLANTISDLIETKKIKPIILVGIPNTQRRRDLTGPTTVEKDKEIAPVVGGSEQFRAFIAHELIPEINKRYRTTDKKGIIGESLAGLFVTETLFLTPDLFDFYIAFDPSLWWNDQWILKSADELITRLPEQKKIFWFTASNTVGIFKPTSHLARILKKKDLPNLIWKFTPKKKEKHYTIFKSMKLTALTWTLTTEFGHP